MGRLVDLTGQRFGRLVVLNRVDDYRPPNDPDKMQPCWRCVCDCGQVVIAQGNNLKRGGTRSCGCLRRETASLNGRLNRGRHWTWYGGDGKRQSSNG